MTRLGHQGLILSRAWIGVDELIGSATQRLKRYQPEVKIAGCFGRRTSAIVCASCFD